jgi:hypothetical protein
MFKHSTNVGAGGIHEVDRVSTLVFDRSDRKTIFYNIILRHGRDWNNPNGKTKWHEAEDPKFGINFVDGHAEYYDFWWKKTSGYDPARGKNLDWIIENLNIY